MLSWYHLLKHTIGCPQMARMDLGSENVEVARFQTALRMNHTDVHAGEKSIRFGSSPTNSVCMHAVIICENSIQNRE